MWAVIGPLFYGFGYCPLTDWHWDILHSLGETNLPSSYVKYLADRLTGLDFDPGRIDLATGISYVAALMISVGINTRDFLRRRAAKS